ncbi:MAG: hypothetical protein ACYDCG_16585 [Candidatus Acidiferrales bacterium]
MNEYSFGSGGRPQKNETHRNCDDKVRYNLDAEEQLLRLIFSRAPLAEVLNGICIALDCQIGNVVSLISLPDDGASELGAIAANATLFGLYAFCSGGIVAENHEHLGALATYCSVPRNPSPGELQLIERAMCLAAIAIKFDQEAGRQSNCSMLGKKPMKAAVLEWPVSFN